MNSTTETPAEDIAPVETDSDVDTELDDEAAETATS